MYFEAILVNWMLVMCVVTTVSRGWDTYFRTVLSNHHWTEFLTLLLTHRKGPPSDGFCLPPCFLLCSLTNMVLRDLHLSFWWQCHHTLIPGTPTGGANYKLSIIKSAVLSLTLTPFLEILVCSVELITFKKSGFGVCVCCLEILLEKWNFSNILK